MKTMIENDLLNNDLLNNDLLNKIKDAIDKIKSNKEIVCDIDLMYDDILLMKSIIEDNNNPPFSIKLLLYFEIDNLSNILSNI